MPPQQFCLQTVNCMTRLLDWSLRSATVARIHFDLLMKLRR